MRRLVMAAAASLIALVLTGCGEDSKPVETTTTPATSTAPADTTKADDSATHTETTTAPAAEEQPASEPNS